MICTCLKTLWKRKRDDIAWFTKVIIIFRWRIGLWEKTTVTALSAYSEYCLGEKKIIIRPRRSHKLHRYTVTNDADTSFRSIKKIKTKPKIIVCGSRLFFSLLDTYVVCILYTRKSMSNPWRASSCVWRANCYKNRNKLHYNAPSVISPSQLRSACAFHCYGKDDALKTHFLSSFQRRVPRNVYF